MNDDIKALREARWYCLDRDGVAMLCKDESDARAQVIENDDCWPGRAPHRAALLVEDAERLRRELRDAQPLTLEQCRGLVAQHFENGELCGDDLTLIRAVENAHGIGYEATEAPMETTEELERLRAENAKLAREAHTWWSACRDAAAEVERLRELTRKT